MLTEDEIHSLATSQRLLGTREVILIHHTDLRQSIKRILTSPFVPHTDSVRGFVFDVATGRLREVK